MKYIGVAAFLIGLLLWIRVMFFGVRRVEHERQYHRRSPLAAAAFFLVGGAVLYLRARAGPVTPGWTAAVVLMAAASAAGAWWLVHRSASIPSTDPEDDPRFRFQGHVARITEAIAGPGGGRIAFDYDGRRLEFRALWTAAADLPEDRDSFGQAGSEVVIETVDGDVAYVEPWVLVEERL